MFVCLFALSFSCLLWVFGFFFHLVTTHHQGYRVNTDMRVAHYVLQSGFSTTLTTTLCTPVFRRNSCPPTLRKLRKEKAGIGESQREEHGSCDNFSKKKKKKKKSLHGTYTEGRAPTTAQ